MTTRDDIALSTGHFVPCLRASPPAFVDSALVPGALGAVKSVQKEPKALPPPSRFVVGDGVEIFS